MTLGRKTKKAIESRLLPDEEILLEIKGFFPGGLAITNQRIFIHKYGATYRFSELMNSWDIEGVSGVELIKDFFHCDAIILFVEGTEPVTEYRISDRGSGSVTDAPNAFHPGNDKDLESKISQLKQIIIDHKNSGQSEVGPARDVANQLREFSKLRDEGIITEVEFTAKKAELLGL